MNVSVDQKWGVGGRGSAGRGERCVGLTRWSVDFQTPVGRTGIKILLTRSGLRARFEIRVLPKHTWRETDTYSLIFERKMKKRTIWTAAGDCSLYVRSHGPNASMEPREEVRSMVEKGEHHSLEART